MHVKACEADLDKVTATSLHAVAGCCCISKRPWRFLIHFDSLSPAWVDGLRISPHARISMQPELKSGVRELAFNPS